jgi:hypothetical protein|tara:strand:- start:307 stop:501 length:195 start_codon:yes stop_codon:yes gene_type:complete
MGFMAMVPESPTKSPTLYCCQNDYRIRSAGVFNNTAYAYPASLYPLKSLKEGKYDRRDSAVISR